MSTRKCTACGYSLDNYDLTTTLCAICEGENYYPGADDNTYDDEYEFGKAEPVKIGGPKYEPDPNLTDPDAWNTLRKDELKELAQKSWQEGYEYGIKTSEAIARNARYESQREREMLQAIQDLLNEFAIPRWATGRKPQNIGIHTVADRVRWLLERSTYRIDEMGVLPTVEPPF